MSDTETIGASKAARLLDVSERTINRWAADGTLPTAELTVGGTRRFARHAVEGLRQARQAVAS